MYSVKGESTAMRVLHSHRDSPPRAGNPRRTDTTSRAVRVVRPFTYGRGARCTSPGDAVVGPRLYRSPGDDRFADLTVSRAPRRNHRRAAAGVAAALAVRHRRLE